MSTDETARSDAGHTAEDAVREMEEQLKPTDPAAPHAPPLREEYGGPRHASDGQQVSPDPSEPERSALASGPSGEERGEEGDEDDDMPPPVPPTEPPPIPVQDPPPQPSPPYVVKGRRGGSTRPA